MATENGQQSSGLTLAVGSFGSSQTNSQISLYLNGTLVSQANIPKGLHLYYDSACVQGNVVSGTQGPPGKQNPNNPIVIETTGGSTTPQANLAYYSSTEPTGDQIATSDNGKSFYWKEIQYKYRLVDNTQHNQRIHNLLLIITSHLVCSYITVHG